MPKGTPGAESGTPGQPHPQTTNQQDILQIGIILGKKKLTKKFLAYGRAFSRSSDRKKNKSALFFNFIKKLALNFYFKYIMINTILERLKKKSRTAVKIRVKYMKFG